MKAVKTASHMIFLFIFLVVVTACSTKPLPTYDAPKDNAALTYNPSEHETSFSQDNKTVNFNKTLELLSSTDASKPPMDSYKLNRKIAGYVLLVGIITPFLFFSKDSTVRIVGYSSWATSLGAAALLNHFSRKNLQEATDSFNRGIQPEASLEFDF